MLCQTLIDWEYHTSSTTEEVAMLFTWRGLGLFIGATFLGHLFNQIHHDLLLGCAALIAGICNMLIPWFHSLIPISILFGLQGVPFGILSVGKFTYKTLTFHIWFSLHLNR